MEVLTQPTIRHYRLLPDRLAEAENRTRRRILFPQIAVMGVLLAISIFLGTRAGAGIKYTVGWAVFLGVWLTYSLFMSPRRLHKKRARCWETYSLEIGPDYLLRRQADTPDIRLSFSDIKRIERRPGEYVRVVGNQNLHVIGIPEGIDHFDEVWQTVSNLAPTAAVGKLHQVRSVIAPALGATLFLAALWTSSPAISLTLLTLFIGLAVWGIVISIRSPNVPRKVRRTAILLYSWLIFLSVLKVISTLPAVLGK